MTLNLQYMAASDHRFIGPVATVPSTVAQPIAVDDLAVIATPSAQDTIMGHTAGIQIRVQTSFVAQNLSARVLSSESAHRLTIVDHQPVFSCGILTAVVRVSALKVSMLVMDASIKAIAS